MESPEDKVDQMAFTIGIDYGTNTVRAIVVDCSDGREIASCIVDYPTGKHGVILDPRDHHVARQHPGDYLFGLQKSLIGALEQASKFPDFKTSGVIGIGIDTTGSSPLPVDRNNVPLGLHDKFKDHLAAQCWLWKDHTSYDEALQITRTAAEFRPEYIAKCGNMYSSEWFWSKIWHCLKTAPEVFESAFSWVELADYIPSVLSGVTDPLEIKRGVCAAGHKALYCDEWGGLPDKEFLARLDPHLAELRDRLYDRAWDATTAAGKLCSEWAGKTGLPAGIPIAIGEFDVHYGAIASGIEEGVLVKAIGTSTCDCCVVKADKHVQDIPGICGIVKGAILPGYYGIEAGQSAVGDIFNWWVEAVCEGTSSLHAELTRKAAAQKPGQNGLIALDWNNGNRTILVDTRLSGIILGQTLHTTRADIYRALIEATAFGARVIIERIREYGVPVERVVCCGGVAEKNPLLMQIYADVTGCAMQIAGSSQTCALGSAISAAVLAGERASGYPDFQTAQKRMTSLKPVQYQPIPENVAIYNRLYRLYRQLHDSFGGLNKNADLSELMKELIRIREEQTHA
jgi:L-ribulokinase